MKSFLVLSSWMVFLSPVALHLCSLPVVHAFTASPLTTATAITTTMSSIRQGLFITQHQWNVENGHHGHRHYEYRRNHRHRHYKIYASGNDSNDESSSSSSSSSNNDQEFMASLQNRIQQSKTLETIIPLIVLDSMLPRQKLTLTVQNQLLLNLIASRVRNETPTLGMIGMAKLQSGSMVHLTKGVEVEITIVDDDSNDDDDNDMKEGTVVEFKAGRRLQLDGEINHTDEGWSEGKVIFLSSKQEEDDEIAQNIGSQDPVSSIANAITKAKELSAPNLNLPNQMSLIDRWIELATQNERRPGQISTLIQDLGNVPGENEPSEIAFWVGSLINPLPAMGVANEIRPALLMAESAEERIQIAYDGILRSIKHMDGSARMW